MTNRQIEERLKTAMQNAAPNDVESILSRCNQQKGSVISMTKQNHSNHKWIRAAIAAAACLALILGLGGYYSNYAVASLVSLDVNPSVQLELNRRERVLEATALNGDARELLGDLDLKDVPADVAVNALIGAMVQNGYVNENANSVLISVKSGSGKTAQSLETKLGQTASTAMQDSQLEGSVISLIVDDSEDLLEELAESNQISQGKVQMILQMIRQNPNLNLEALAALPVNDLNLLANSDGRSLPAARRTGKASDAGYIGEQAAVTAALQHAGVSAAEASVLEVDFDLEDGIMVYEVEFTGGSTLYEYEINAASGTVVSQEKENLPASAQKLISRDEALGIALTQAGTTEDQIAGLKAKLDKEDRRLVYEVEFILNGMEYEYEIDAATGAVLDSDKDKADYTAKTAAISPEDAVQTALTHAGILQKDAMALKAELDEEDHRLVYEIEFIKDGVEYEYDIDAATGEVVKAEKDDEKKNFPDKTIGESTAADKALAHAGVSRADAHKLEVDEDRKNGRAVYQVRFETSAVEYEYEVDALNGDILKAEKDEA